MMGPVRGKYFISLSAQQQVERLPHLFSHFIAPHFVEVRYCPSFKIEATLWVFPFATGSLHDAIKRYKCQDDYFSHTCSSSSRALYEQKLTRARRSVRQTLGSRTSRVHHLRKAAYLPSSGMHTMQSLASFEPPKFRSERTASDEAATNTTPLMPACPSRPCRGATIARRGWACGS